MQAPANDDNGGTLAVILYRLDDIQRDMERLATVERVDDLTRRIGGAEQRIDAMPAPLEVRRNAQRLDEITERAEQEKKWRRSMALAVGVALIAPSVTTIAAYAFPSTPNL